MKLILASQSPRRRELLASADYDFEVVPPRPEVDERARDGESPRELVTRLAREKASDVAARTDCGLILGCDTIAEIEGQILGKPRDRAHAAEMLRTLRGTQHCVHSGVCLWHRPSDHCRVDVDITLLRMELVSDEELETYLDTGLWQGKAGAFGYQDQLDWVHIEQGSESNVVGLPMELLQKMLYDFADMYT